MLLVAAAKALRHLSSQLVILVLLVDFSRASAGGRSGRVGGPFGSGREDELTDSSAGLSAELRLEAERRED